MALYLVWCYVGKNSRSKAKGEQSRMALDPYILGAGKSGVGS